MSLTLSRLHITDRTENVMWISNELDKKLKLKGQRNVTLELGSKKLPVSIRSINKKGKHVYLSSSVYRSMNVPAMPQCYIANHEKKNVRLGPLLGIITTAVRRTPQRPFGDRTAMVRRYLTAGRNRSFYFAFSPQDINWRDETVNAYFINRHGGWIRREVPLPDAVFNRLFSRRFDHSHMMNELKNQFLKRKIPFFNWSYFNKWDIYSLLQDEMRSLQHVPESYLNPSITKIKEMIKKHRFIYLKPTAGSQGNGIYRITYLPSRGYFVRFRGGNQNNVLRYNSLERLMSMLVKKVRLKNYVAQQGIELAEVDQCPIDFRVHLNKNGLGDWVVTGIGAKKAGRGSITTHIKNGGQLLSTEQALSRTFGSQASLLRDKMIETSVRLAEKIEKKYEHRIGELGLDIGIDKKGFIWMFEANAMPGRSIFNHPTLRSGGRDNLRYIYDHLVYLSGFRRRVESE